MFRKMEYVYAVYTEKSFTKAAEKLFISQPCLSAAIKKTEELVGEPLFERRYSSAELTETGRLYIEAVEKIMNAKREFEEKTNDIKELEYGSLSIGCSNFASSYITPSIVSRFSKLYPKIEISLTEAASVDLEKKLSDGELDLVIDSFDKDELSEHCIPFAKEKILLAVPSGYSCNNGISHLAATPEAVFKSGYSNLQEVPVSKFSDFPFILLKQGHNMAKHASAVFRGEGLAPRVLFRMDQLLTSYSLTASGMGISFVTDSLFRHHRFDDNVLLYNIKNDDIRYMCITWNKSRYLTIAMSRFIKEATGG